MTLFDGIFIFPYVYCCVTTKDYTHATMINIRRGGGSILELLFSMLKVSGINSWLQKLRTTAPSLTREEQYGTRARQLLGKL